MPDAISFFFRYKAIADIYAFQAVIFHILFGSVLWLVFRGNKKPGWRLLSLTFASMSFSVFYTALSQKLFVNAVAFLVLFFCAAYDVYQPLTHWSNGVHRPIHARRFAFLCLAWAWFYPHYISPWKAIVAAPLGLIPSPTLLALLSLLWLAFPQTNRLLHWAAAILGLLYGLFGVLYLHVFSDAFLVVIAGLNLWDLKRAVQEAGGVFEDDYSPNEEPKAPPDRTKKDQIWRI